MQQRSSARFTRSRKARSGVSAACTLAAFASLLPASAPAASDTNTAGDTGTGIRLELTPRICTLTSDDTQCETRVSARWQSSHEESLCLVILDRPEVKRCWENYSKGVYSIELVFAQDLIFQLKDLELRKVLASEALRVIREAIHYRHKRRQPWNIFG